jgi:hydroxymethylbilane synthase
MRLGTRRSKLALAQATAVAELLGGCEIVPIVTGGDRGDAPAADKSRWVAELEQALTRGDIDIAVHSAKDLPGELAAGLELLGTPARAAREDMLVGAGSLSELRAGARVGTSSVRRLAQLRAARSDLEVVALRGNVDTRLAKLADGAQALDAIVLARAGLERLGIAPACAGELDPARFVPAPGQGALALEGRAEDERARAAARAITDESALACLLAERALAQALDASCHTPLGASATPAAGGGLHLRAWVGLPDGSAWASDEQLGERSAPAELAALLAGRLRAVGADELLARAREEGARQRVD